MFAQGQGVPQGYVRAHMVVQSLSGARGQTRGQDRDIVANLMVLAQIAGAQKLAPEWRPASENRKS